MSTIEDYYNYCKGLGWIMNKGNGKNSVGVTFEKTIGIKENSDPKADFHGIEIKTKYSKTRNSITLFSCLPFNYNDIDKFKNLVGKKDAVVKDANVLFMLIRANKICKANANCYTSMSFDKDLDRIVITASNIKYESKTIEVFWLKEQIEHRVKEKCSKLAFINADRKIEENISFFKYTRLRLYKLKSIEKFFELLENGIIFIIFNIGVYRTADKYGQTYNHGVTFCINENNLKDLYTLEKEL